MKTRSSIVNPGIRIPDDKWLISVVKTDGMSSMLGGGHSVLVVEGIQNTITSFPEKFIGQYDIWRIIWNEEDKSTVNKKGKITQIRIFDNGRNSNEAEWKPVIDYSQLSSTSFKVDRDDAIRMINAIKVDRDRTRAAEQNIGEFIPFQFVGANHPLSEVGKGHNCSSWCVEKIGVAGIHDLDSKLTKPKKLVSPGCAIL